MKPWLFDILACPIDKYFPLKLYILSFETKPEEFQAIHDIYEKRNIEEIKKEKIIKNFNENGIDYIKDNIIIQKKPIDGYLKEILASIDELNHIYDKTTNKICQNSLDLITSQIKQKIIDYSKEPNIDNLDKILPELYFVNKIKLETEIEMGILFCEECKRWFPIIETIPQLLPDQYRDMAKEIKFLKTNKNLLDDEFFNQELKPFNV